MSNPSLSSIMMPLMRTVMPKMIANELVGVQPLSGPSGQIYGRQFRMKRKRKMREQLHGFTFLGTVFQYMRTLPKEEIEVLWLKDNIEFYKEAIKQGNVNTTAEKWKEQRKKIKKALKARIKRYKDLEDNFPHRFI